jgi:very-short-patch-repair endonuclease
MEYVCLITDHIIEKGSLPKGNYSLFPLYLYPEISEQQTIDQTAERTPNLNLAIVKEIAEKLGVAFANEKTPPSLPKGEGQNSFGRNGEVTLHHSYNNANPINSPSLPKGEGQNSFGRNIDPHLQPGYVTANPNTYKHIKEMRDDLKDNPTEAEKVMWEYLRNKKTGHKIRRQHIIDDFIPDFVCLSKKIIIEIDGKIHLQQKEQDELRTARLNELGYEVIRFTNEEVFANPELVALKTKEKLESPIVEKYITQYPIDGDNVVIKPRFVVSAPLLESLVEIGKVYINDTQYFDNVPQTAWDFYIGGYQPAQKWLKDRKERKLEFNDIFHYQKIIVALFETDRLMKEIDKIEIE